MLNLLLCFLYDLILHECFICLLFIISCFEKCLTFFLLPACFALLVGGIMMELVPLRVHEPVGTRTTFSCSYRSNERLSIEFEALKEYPGVRLVSKREILSDYFSRYSWGANRKWTLVLEAEHRMVVCRLKNSRGGVVGQLTAVLNPGLEPCTVHIEQYNTA